MADDFPSWSPYNYVFNNPLKFIDPDGRSPGEFELDKDGNWQKVSTKGDDIGVDFYHMPKQGNGPQETHVTDGEGNWNIINNGRYALQGEQRGGNVDWNVIYEEFTEGTGPERSVFEGNHQSVYSIKNNYLYKKAFKSFEKSGDSKGGGEVSFYPWDIIRTGTNMQVQMMGSYNASFYKLGDRTLSLVQDSKSRTSYYYHLPVTNYSRSETRYYTFEGGNHYHGRSETIVIPHNKESNTYQTYIFYSDQ